MLGPEAQVAGGAARRWKASAAPMNQAEADKGCQEAPLHPRPDDGPPPDAALRRVALAYHTSMSDAAGESGRSCIPACATTPSRPASPAPAARHGRAVDLRS